MLINASQLQAWLAPLEGLPLECDGLSRVISILLHREAVPHSLLMGSLHVKAVGFIGWHFWITLPSGLICDFRARMWLGDSPDVPHGVLVPTNAMRYEAESGPLNPCHPALYEILTERRLDDYPRFQSSSSASHPAPRPSIAASETDNAPVLTSVTVSPNR